MEGPVKQTRETKKAPEIRSVGSLPGSSASFFAARLILEQGSPVLVLWPDEEAAARCAEEISFYLKALAGSASCFHLPERRLYDPLSAGGDRSAALAAMVSASAWKPVAVSASIKAALFRTPSPEMFVEHLYEIKAGTELDRDELLSALVRGGYASVSAVMEPGDFSVRGGIMDVFPPGRERPLRLEWWEDRIESLREFSPHDQKSTAEIDRGVLPPFREVLITPETAKLALGQVQDFMEKLKKGGVPGVGEVSVLEGFREILSRIESRDHFPGVESFLPAFHPEPRCALDYLDSSWTVIYMEPFLCEQTFARELSRMEEDWREELKAGRFALSPSLNFVSRLRAEDSLSPCRVLVSGAAAGSSEAEEKSTLLSRGAEEDDSSEPAPPRVSVSEPSEISAIHANFSGFRPRPEEEDPMRGFVDSLSSLLEDGFRLLLVASARSAGARLKEILEAHALSLPMVEDPAGVLRTGPESAIAIGPLTRGFIDHSLKLAVIPEAEIFGEKRKVRARRQPPASFLTDLSDLKEGDYVVHAEHGVGIYRGLKSLEVQWIGEWDFVREKTRPRLRVDSAVIEYAGGATLYVPVHRVNLLSKYSGPSETPPALDTLGGTAWERLKKKVKKSIQDFAGYLLKIQAQRRLGRGSAFPPPDHVFREFEEEFPFEETPDQARAIEEVLLDMQKETPMDRVVCGDVGYGKTEVALRAAFLAAMSGKQVALLVPTTILAQQHYELFMKRLSKYPLEVRMLSRFLSARETKETLKGLELGTVDIVIGTHRLLSKDVKFKDLGLLIIDEEHRFGVRHKERLRELRATVDTLALSATPIPRTLYMALSGLRELSIIDTPPPDRLAVHTELVRADDGIIREAIERELRRGGQVFFVHNRVQTIEAAADRVARLVPQARVAVAHGRMEEKKLAKVMREFVEKRFDVLVCTAIIESGLDIPAANTMLIDRADQFGLAQLYQLRGRVGRSKERAYCYLLVPAKGILTKDAAKRLAVLKEFAELGGGFRLAAHDLELRGAGNLLGPEQSGHLQRIGLELYLQLLEEEIRRLRGEPVAEEVDPEIKLPVPAFIPEDYMPDQNQRLSWYKRLARAAGEEEADALMTELYDRYGPPPDPVLNLVEVSKIKARLRKLRARELAFTGEELVLALNDDSPVKVEKVVELAARKPAQYRLSPDNRFFKSVRAESPDKLFPEVRTLLSEISPAGEEAGAGA